MRKTHLLLSWICGYFLCAGAQRSPGIIGRINPTGFTWVKDLIGDWTTSQLQTAKPPNIRGTWPLFFELRNIDIKAFTIGEPHFNSTPPNVLNFGVTGAAISLTAIWSRRFSIEASLVNIDVNQTVFLGTNEEGKLRFILGDCTASAGSLRMSAVETALASFYNILLAMANSRFRNSIGRFICPVVRRHLHTLYQKYLESTDVRLLLLNDIALDMRFFLPPQVQVNRITLYSGWCSYSNASCLSSVESFIDLLSSELPQLSEPYTMIQVLVRDDVINSFLTSLYESRLFEFSTSLQEISEILDLGFTDETSSLDGDEPQSSVKRRLRSYLTSPPHVTLKNGSIVLEGKFESVGEVVAENGTVLKVGSLNAVVSLQGIFNISEDFVTVKFGEVTLLDSDYEGLPKEFAQAIFNGISSTKLVQLINGFTSYVTLPDFLDKFLKKPEANMHEGYVEIGADLKPLI